MGTFCNLVLGKQKLQKTAFLPNSETNPLRATLRENNIPLSVGDMAFPQSLCMSSFDLKNHF